MQFRVHNAKLNPAGPLILAAVPGLDQSSVDTRKCLPFLRLWFGTGDPLGCGEEAAWKAAGDKFQDLSIIEEMCNMLHYHGALVLGVGHCGVRRQACEGA